MKRSIDWQMDELCSIILRLEDELDVLDAEILEMKLENEDRVLDFEIFTMLDEKYDREEELKEYEEELDLAESGHSEFGYTDEDLYE
jgi:hypothetical protein